MLDSEITKTLTNDIETLRKIRVVLGTINIEAKSASDVLSIDSALGSLIESLSGITSYINDNRKEPAKSDSK